MLPSKNGLSIISNGLDRTRIFRFTDYIVLLHISRTIKKIFL
jgi:hypothetical protein